MYCPNCGHQPSTTTARFCAGCGFRLDGVVKLIEAGGAIELLQPNTSTNSGPFIPPLTPRRKGIRFGGKLMFASLASLPLTIAFSIGIDEPVPIIFSIFLFFAGLSWMLYARLFREDYLLPQAPVANPEILGESNTGPLSFTNRLKPPSVVESTTKLLKRKRDQISN
ncbi:MAG TPA: hypothetical protein VEF04_00085 [Blastocatellia bacterium]|nr:hypothetical protein [Blastocatellia bacterium]